MPHEGGPVDIEALLRHRPFVRALARSLVIDDASADDLVQETWLTALRHPPRHAGALRAWLASVVRKLAFTQRRGARRRVARERRGPLPVPPSLPAEALERAQWHRRLVDAVMELAEPYRTTILLSYFEELTSGEIARLQGVPSATVRTRLRRGLARLRERLDAEVEGGRRAWMLALAPLAFGDLRSAAAAATLAPAGWKATAVAAAMLAATAVVTTLALRTPPASRRADEPARREAAVPEEPVAGTLPAPATSPGYADDEGAQPEQLEVTVLAGGRPAAGARIVLARTREHPWRWTPHDPWYADRTATADDEGRARMGGLADGHVRVVAMLPGYGRGEAFVHLPQRLVHPLVLELPEERTIVVEVQGARAATPLAGARVTLLEAGGGEFLPRVEPVVTDAQGRATVRGPAAGEAVRLAATLDGFARAAAAPAPDAESVVVRLDALDRSVRWPIASGAPREGTQILLRRVNEPAGEAAWPPAHVEGPFLVVDGLADGAVPELIACCPDGRFARLAAEARQEVAHAIDFVEPVLLEVVVHDTAGAPVAAIPVRVEELAGGSPLHPQARTDALGRARLPVYLSDRVALQVGNETLGTFRTVRTYDPVAGSARVQVTLPRARAVRLRVRCDGVASLPACYRLLQEGATVDPAAVTSDPSQGLLRLVVRPEREGEEVTLHMLARDYLPATVRIRPEGRAGADLDLDLVRAGTLVVHVLLRGAEQPFHLELVDPGGERSAAQRGPWSFRLYPGPDRVVRERMLPPGRYRVRDTVSGKASEEFTTLPGPGETRVYLDLRAAEPPPPTNVRGVVRAHGYLDLARASVLARTGSREARIEVARDGGFALAWDGEDLLHLRATHPDVADTEAAEIVLAGPRDDVVLLLTPLHRAVARLGGGDVLLAPGGTSPRVLLRSAREAGLVVDATVTGDALRFGGFLPGRHRIWVDLPGFAPIDLGEHDLRAGDNDLGVVLPERGTSLRFRVVGGEDALAPELILAAQAIETPRYQRSVLTNGETQAVLPGLGAGRFRVTAWERYTGQQVWSEVVVADGSNDVACEIDLGRRRG